MNVVPAFMKSKREPTMGEPQQPSLPFSPEVAQFIDHTTKQREELAYWKTHATQLEQEVKLLKEQMRLNDREMIYSRDDRDRVYRAYCKLKGVFAVVMAGIVDAEKDDRDNGYIAPAVPAVETEQDRQIIEGLREQLTPTPPNGKRKAEEC